MYNLWSFVEPKLYSFQELTSGIYATGFKFTFNFLQAMFKSNRGTVSGYFLAGRFMTWLPVSEILCCLVDWVIDKACSQDG